MREKPISVRLGLTMDRPVVLIFKIAAVFLVLFSLIIFLGWMGAGGTRVAEYDLRLR